MIGQQTTLFRSRARRRAFLAAWMLPLSAATGFALIPSPSRADAPSPAGAQPSPSGAQQAAPLQIGGGAASVEEEEAILPLTADPAVLRELLSPGEAKAARKPAPRAKPQAGTGAAPQDAPGKITVRKFQKLQWSPGGNTFRSQGRVEIFYQNEADRTDRGTTLTASDVEADAESGQVEARGGIRLEREEGTITGQQIRYNFNSRAGYVTEAIAITDYFRMSGRRIETEADGSYVVLDGLFTTCLNDRPDYRIRAGRLKVSPNRYVSARNISLYVGPTKLISLPSYRRSLRSAQSAPVPTVGYSKSEGVLLRFRDTPIVQPFQTLDFDLRFNLKRLPAGYIGYQRDLTRSARNPLEPRGLVPRMEDPMRGFLDQFTPPTYRDYASNLFGPQPEPRATFFAALQNDQFVYNRRRSDLLVSRFPELGVRFANVLGHPLSPPQLGPDGRPIEPEPQPPGSTDAALLRIANAPFLLDFTATAGAYRERPADVSFGRFSLRADIASQPILLARRLSARLGVTHWINAYSNGDLYNLFSPEVEVNYVPTRTSLFGIGYRFAEDFGRTPFFFDQRDLRHELRLRAQVGGPWGFGFITRLDLERSRAYDSEIAILRNLDCMQVGVAYSIRNQQFSVLFNLLPPVPSRERRLRNLPPEVGGASPTAAMPAPERRGSATAQQSPGNAAGDLSALPILR